MEACYEKEGADGWSSAVRAAALCTLARVGPRPGGNEAGEGDEGGGQGTVDGWAPGARLGQERTVSWTLYTQ